MLPQHVALRQAFPAWRGPPNVRRTPWETLPKLLHAAAVTGPTALHPSRVTLAQGPATRSLPPSTPEYSPRAGMHGRCTLIIGRAGTPPGALWSWAKRGHEACIPAGTHSRGARTPTVPSSPRRNATQRARHVHRRQCQPESELQPFKAAAPAAPRERCGSLTPGMTC